MSLEAILFVIECLSGVVSASSVFIEEKSAPPTPTMMMDMGRSLASTMESTVFCMSAKWNSKRKEKKKKRERQRQREERKKEKDKEKEKEKDK